MESTRAACALQDSHCLAAFATSRAIMQRAPEMQWLAIDVLKKMCVLKCANTRVVIESIAISRRALRNFISRLVPTLDLEILIDLFLYFNNIWPLLLALRVLTSVIFTFFLAHEALNYVLLAVPARLCLNHLANLCSLKGEFSRLSFPCDTFAVPGPFAVLRTMNWAFRFLANSA